MVSSDVESYTAMTEIENLTQSWDGMCLHISLCQQTCTIVCTIKQKHLMKRDQRTYNKTLNIIKVGEKKKLICKKMKSNITKILIKKFWKRCETFPLNGLQRCKTLHFGCPLSLTTLPSEVPALFPPPPYPKKKRTLPEAKPEWFLPRCNSILRH